MKPQDYKGGEYTRSTELDAGSKNVLFAGLALSAIFGITAALISLTDDTECDNAKTALKIAEISGAKASDIEKEQFLSPYCD